MTTIRETPDLFVDDFMLASAGSHDRPLHFTTNDEDVYRDQSQSATTVGIVVVRIGVDLDHDKVAIDQNHSSQLALLDAAIADLQLVRETLGRLTPTARTGRCMNGAEYGRCRRPEGHEGQCEGQTEAQWRAELDVPFSGSVSPGGVVKPPVPGSPRTAGRR